MKDVPEKPRRKIDETRFQSLQKVLAFFVMKLSMATGFPGRSTVLLFALAVSFSSAVVYVFTFMFSLSLSLSFLFLIVVVSFINETDKEIFVAFPTRSCAVYQSFSLSFHGSIPTHQQLIRTG